MQSENCKKLFEMIWKLDLKLTFKDYVGKVYLKKKLVPNEML